MRIDQPACTLEIIITALIRQKLLHATLLKPSSRRFGVKPARASSPYLARSSGLLAIGSVCLVRSAFELGD